MFTNIKLLLNSLATFLPFTIVASADDGLHTHHQRLVREGDGFASRIWILGVRTCFFFLLAVAANAFGQATDNWIFGHHAWINVKGNTAVGVTTMIPPLSTGEGSSSISDNNGNLLFYTDGKTVWNRLHQPMAAPTLSGNPSSTNSALIVPCSCNQYFVFTTDAAENRYEKGLNYSVVDMTLNAGLGGVIPTRTNIPLLANSTEKLAATTATGGGFWLVGHHLLNNEFHAWHILANSDNCEHLELQQAVISKVGTDYNSNSSHYGQGQMKFSPNGTRLAVAGLAFNGSFVEVFQFSKATGVVSDIFLGGTTQDTLPVVYGVEFSPTAPAAESRTKKCGC